MGCRSISLPLTAAHRRLPPPQVEALATAAVLCHAGKGVPGDAYHWEALQEVMRLHSGNDGVQLVRAPPKLGKRCDLFVQTRVRFVLW